MMRAMGTVGRMPAMVRTLKCHNTITNCGPCPTSKLYHISLPGANTPALSSVVTFRKNISYPLLDLADGSNSHPGSYRDLLNPTNMRL
jgi:hypothetical protein